MSRPIRPVVGMLLFAALAPHAARAQGSAIPGDTAAFIATARTLTTRYQRQEAAIADGFRLIGPDFPSMGEHWVNGSRFFGVAANAPPNILEYVTINGVPTLVGLAYAVLVPVGAAPPTQFPVGRSEWHYHSGTVDQESFIAGHVHGSDTTETTSRVAVLHVWAWLPNPAGSFATDNWALPFARMGWPAPVEAVTPSAARAVALAGGGARYFTALIGATQHPDTAARRRIASHFVRAASEIRQMLANDPPGSPPSAAQLATAAAQWDAVWREAIGMSGY